MNTETKRKRGSLRALFKAFREGSLCPRADRPGAVVEGMRKEDREDLKGLKSDDIKDHRIDFQI
jgi:hypothetical protein